MRTLRHFSLFVVLTATLALAQANPVPLLYQTIPVSIKPGSKGFTLTVSGTGFVSGAVVQWNGTPRTTTFVSQSEVQATISAKDVAKASTASVTVLNAKGAVSSNVLYFPIRNSSSTVTMKDGTHSILSGAIAVGDFNTDGKLGVIVDFTKEGGGVRNGTIYNYLGKGNGTFELSQKIQHVIFANTMTTGDFNDSGNLDILISRDNVKVAASSQMFPGSGKGTLGAPVNSNAGGYFMAPADLNGDGKLDLAEEEFFAGGTQLMVSLGNGDGTFSYVPGNPNGGGQVAVGDFNGDGKLDLAETSCYPSSRGCRSVKIFLGNGDGTFNFDNPVTYETPYLASGIAAVDLNGDGILDLVTDGVSVLLGNGDGTFTLGSSVQVANAVYPACQNVNVGDFDGDGKLDVAVISVDQNGNQTVAILLGNGDGTFQKPIEFAGGENPSIHNYGFFVGDFNNDGKLDLILEQKLTQGHTHLFLQQ